MNRRDFTRLSALALSATRFPSLLAQPAPARPVGYAAIGLGTISDIFIRACADSQTSRITALVTGHADTKGRKYAAQYGIPESSIYTYETFDRIRDNQNVDAVYIGLPNSMHREYTVRAAAAGKHVLCEKPMAISSAECREMIAACQKAQRKLMIAYRCQYDPTFLAARQIIQSGQLGELQLFEGAFGFNAPNQNFWRLNRALAGGGSLMDVGIYPLNAARFFTGQEPAGFTAQASTTDRTTSRFREVEQSVTWTMNFPSGVLFTGASSYGSTLPGFLRVHGTKASLELAPAFNYTGTQMHGFDHLQASAATPGGQTYQFTLEADHFSNCIRNNTEPKTPGEEGLKDLLAIEQIYQAAGAPIA